MASRKENLKSLFSNTRTRVIILFTTILLLVAVGIGVGKLRSSGGAEVSSDISNAPGGIQSIPGSMDPTAQYAKLQEEQNLTQAANAENTGGSSIPTIIRTQALGEGVGVVGAQGGQTGVGFSALSREDDAGAQRSLWIQALQKGACSKNVIEQVVTQGAQLADLKQACSCVQLKDSGITLPDLEQVCECKELRAAGYNARQLKDAGYTAARLRSCGYDACELRNAGFTAQEMKDGGFSDGELKGAGYSDLEIAKAGGLPNGMTADEVRDAGCGEAALTKLRKAGVSASAIRRISGCSAEQMKAAGFTAQDLKEAGFSAADLSKAGFTAAELKGAGYTARDLLNAGFTANDLAKAGFKDSEIKAAQGQLPPGITADDVKNSGCDVDELKREKAAGVSAASIKQFAGCSAQALKAAGFTDSDLANAGFTKEEIAAAVPMSDNDIRAAGCDSEKLKKLLNAGVSAKQIKSLNGCSAQALKDAGFSAKSMLDAGYTPAQLIAAGYTAAQLQSAGLSPADILASGRADGGCSVDSLKKAKAAGVSALTIKQTLGCSAQALKAAGYSVKELKDAGFTAAELKNAGFSANELKGAGFSAKELHDAGYSVQELKDAGFNAKDLKDAGFSAAELQKAGFSASQLKAAGYSGKELRDAGFSADELRKAGFTAKDLKDAGYSADDLQKAGFSLKELKDAGYSADEMRKAGFSAKELKDAGYSAGQLKNAGFSSAELKNAGFSDQESSVAGLGTPNIQQQNSSIGGIPAVGIPLTGQAAENASSSKQLQEILNKQNQQMAEQKYQQKIQQKTSDMQNAANQAIGEWKKVNTQVYLGGSEEGKKEGGQTEAGAINGVNATQVTVSEEGSANGQQRPTIKTGDIVFAVIDTSINSDEPGPILATIVSGKLKGSKLIGSFTLPSNADKMVITFNTMSMPGAAKTMSVSAYAIDPNTARTALSSRTNHHYLMRYGSLFASSFIEGFGNAFQSANTTVTVGGTGGGNNVTVQNGIGRSTLENAVIGLATVGKSWGQQAQQAFNTPTTVEVYSGTGLGILFTQDVQL